METEQKVAHAMTRNERLIKLHEACGWQWVEDIQPRYWRAFWQRGEEDMRPRGEDLTTQRRNRADHLVYDESLDALAAAERATLGDGADAESRRRWFVYTDALNQKAEASGMVWYASSSHLLRMSCEDRFNALGASLGLWGEEGE